MSDLSELLTRLSKLSEKEIEMLTKIIDKKDEENFEEETESIFSSATIKRGKRPNLFEKIKKTAARTNEVKRAGIADKILWKGIEPEERDRKLNLVKVKCSHCGKEEEVPPSMIFSIKGETAAWYCNAHINRGK